ncbi:MAG: hypothetical protein LRZ97_00675, partial [Candidatus Pacebacteria bacterium]|nr:hypothetical protein [Candidatus Paceibacterota bacterium]
MKKISLAIAILFVPVTTFASTYTLKFYVDKFIGVINVIVPILITLAIVLFFYHSGIGIFGSSSGNAEARTKLKETLLWGVGIIFVMVSIWG